MGARNEDLDAARRLLDELGIDLPLPHELGLAADAVVAVPSAGLELFRLVRSDPPSANDFRGQSPERAAARGLPELFRVGLSMYLTLHGATEVKQKPDSRIARVKLPATRRIAIAKTGKDPAHVTVWAPLDLVLPNADVVNRRRTA